MTNQPAKSAINALLTINEKAVRELQELIRDINDIQLATIVDTATEDENCRSIQTILRHVVSSGYSYSVYIGNLKDDQLKRPTPVLRNTAAEYINDLDAVVNFAYQVMQHFNDAELETFEDSQKVHTRWGQCYDIEQMWEHAIVHILRHKRQIEGFKARLGI